MAILEDVPGIRVWVASNGAALSEYEPHDPVGEEAPGPALSKYVECVDNANFTVSLEINNDYEWGYRNHSLTAYVYVDGKYIHGTTMRHTDIKPARGTIYGPYIHDELTGSWSLRRLKFTVVNTIDEAQKERVVRDAEIAKDLGVIEVKVFRVIEGGASKWKRNVETQDKGFELAEKSLKGKSISHGTSYSRGEPTRAPQYVSITQIAEDNGPIAVFRFLYRSREALKRELIIPRTPTRSPTLDGMSEADRDRLARDMLELQSKIKREGQRSAIKREYNETIDLTGDGTVPVVRRPLKKSRLESGEEIQAIDLTED
ncbi:hypothetical protein F4778DRAFT_777151 [Xylariomycetidae sp. FL2044]|nr:hypothetical protein F4778DRAFT_777151 [Xylariomycetidae sp. FL2044]